MVMNCDGWDDSPPDDGYCEHGVYTGGCGWDLMCQWCEDGISAKEAAEILHAQARRRAFESIRCFDQVVLPAIKNGRSRQQILARYAIFFDWNSHHHEWVYEWCVKNNEWPEEVL